MDQCCMGIWFLIPTGSGFCLYFKTREPPVPGFLGRNQNQRNHWFQYFKNLKESPGFTKNWQFYRWSFDLSQIVWEPWLNILDATILVFLFFCLRFLWTLWNTLIPIGYLGRFLIPTQHHYGSLFTFRPSGHLHLFVNSIESNKCTTNFQRHAIYGWWPKIL
jgi:hypothetical protein